MFSAFIVLGFVSISCSQFAHSENAVAPRRSFTIDYYGNAFIKDGERFQYVSGEIHYFRIPRPYWRDRLRKYRIAGLNAIQIYIEWSTHEPTPGNYRFSGQEDVEHFIQLANEEGLLVILRPGPFICAERDMGGFPYWLMTKYPKIGLRTRDRDYQREVVKWFKVLLPKLAKYLYSNGGPIIMVQIENEYGILTDCDITYKLWMRDLLRSFIGDAAILFTVDRSTDIKKGCGSVPGVLTTADFGVEVDPMEAQKVMCEREGYHGGPFVCTEFYTGWIDYWGRMVDLKNTSKILKISQQMLELGWSFNYYMFHGGTNFGFTTGASDVTGVYLASITSYDYDAPLNEAGDPTLKYYLIKDLLTKYFKLPKIPAPLPSPKGNYGIVQLRPVKSLFNSTSSFKLPKSHSIEPKTFEELQQNSGYILYETVVPLNAPENGLLDACFMRDRTHVYVNYNFVGTLCRSDNVYSLSLGCVSGKTLSLLIENQGRIGFGPNINDKKGLLQGPTLNNIPLKGWKMTHISLEDISWLPQKEPSFELANPPAFYSGEFVIYGVPLDTYINLSGWGKGVAFINGINIGRYWPSVGPQVTLYLPGCYLKPAPFKNVITLFETDLAHPLHEIALTNVPIVNKRLTE